MNREYHKWYSPMVQREMEMLVFGHAGPRLVVFPSRLNRFFEYEDHGMVHSLRHHLEAGQLQLFCVDSLDAESLYCFEKPPELRLQRYLEYERYVIEEVIPFANKLNPDGELVTHGCSLGAYHAVTIAFRYPAKFQGVLAFSGRYDLTQSFGEYHNLFHGFSDEALFFLMPTLFLPQLDNAKILRQLKRLRITVVVGEDDVFFANNKELSELLREKRIRHEFHVWCGNAHRFRYWRQMARVYLDSVTGAKKLR